MASFKEVLKEVENGTKKGFKNGAWFPHKSAEGGTRTVAYGHKLSPEEEKGDYVVLPDGTVVDFANRGLTNQEVEILLDSDIQKKRKVAEVQWNAAQKTDFSSLNPMHQALLTEISFNTGSLKNDKGKFGWPRLAKGILSNDNEVIKKEIGRSFTDKKGVTRELTERVNPFRDLIDQFEQDPSQVSLEGFVTPQQPTQPGAVTQAAETITERASQLAPSNLLTELASALNQLMKASPAASQGPSEARTEGRQWTDTEEAIISAAVNAPRAVVEEEVEEESKPIGDAPRQWTPFEEQLIQRATGTTETEEHVVVEQGEAKDDGSKDPTFGIF